ncbi:FAD-binding oxidoreductase [Nocardia speluncae]|uniref:FAD-binding oxidoreductase n=1 Tax=Nocardia speluncae TaxID=419477 RepID=A0A846XCM1_9NOCA|nr:FAD-binding oxidoreductase [Nocardia speluncae]NKY33157.1 FAD-binding oxidoreductase [Nocardia speluncae]
MNAPAGTLAADLAAACRGEILVPGSTAYDLARRGWNGAVDHRPAVIVRCAGRADIAAAVRIASRQGSAVALKGGGHGISRFAAADGAVLLDLTALDAVHVDPDGRRAVVGPGVTWARLDRATQAHGLAVTGADVSSVGVIGSALAGGSGWLQRSFGLTCDNLVSARMVVADGRELTVGPDQHPDLWWALRGAGVNFGVVVEAELRLYPVGTVHAGTLVFQYRHARTVLAAYRRLCASAPDGLALQAALLHWPPGAPEGPPMAAISAVYAGPAEQSHSVLAPLRAIAEPELDLLRPLDYPSVQRQSEQAFIDGYATTTGSRWLHALDDTTIDRLVAAGARMPTPHTMISLHQQGGALSRIAPAATAFGFRGAEHHLALFVSAPAAHLLAPGRDWIAALCRAVRPSAAGGPYIGLLDGDAPELVQTAYLPDSYRRLRTLKTVYDPGNTFRANHNIVPARTRTPQEPSWTPTP